MIEVYQLNNNSYIKFLKEGLHFDKEQKLIDFYMNLPEKDLIYIDTIPTNDLETAFSITQTMKDHRSTSAGDFMKLNGKGYIVAPLGYIPDPRPILNGPKKNLPLYLGLHPSLDIFIEKEIKK